MLPTIKEVGFIIIAVLLIVFYHVVFFLLFVIESLFALFCLPLIKLDGGTWKESLKSYVAIRKAAWRRFTSGEAAVQH